MMLVKLFLTFFEIGAVSFGGGYGMVSLIREIVLANGWMTENEFMSFVAVTESTPGPIAVNMATFVGASQGGVSGALVATLGVVLPSFIIILLIAALMRNLLKYKGVQAFLGGVRPSIAALILGTAVTMGLNTLGGIQTLAGGMHADLRAIAIFALLCAISLLRKTCRKKAVSPILMILLSAGLGIIFYGFL